MKKLFLLAAFCLPLLVRAQLYFDLYAFHGTDQTTRTFNTWGGGANFLSRPLETPPALSFPLKLQLGGGYFIAGAGSKKLELNSNGSESVTFSNSHIGMYGLSRLSVQPGKARRSVYIDFLAGIRCSNATRYQVKDGDSHDETLHAFTGFLGGAGAGLLFRMNDHVFLDVGLQWQSTAPGGKFVVMNTVKNSGDGVSYQWQKAPAHVLMFKVAIQFRTAKVHDEVTECCEVKGCRIRNHHVKSCPIHHQ